MAFNALKHNICCFRKCLIGACHAVSPDRKLAFVVDEFGIDRLVLGETRGLNWPYICEYHPYITDRYRSSNIERSCDFTQLIILSREKYDLIY